MSSRIDSILKQTEDAYSKPNYTPEGWKKSIEALINRGVSDENIVKFLNSKAVRWAADEDDEKTYGSHDETTIFEYLKKYSNEYPHLKGE